MPGRFCKLSEGERHGIRRSLSQLSGKPGRGGVSAGGQGKCGATPVFWPGEFHGLYSPWGHKESDTTEQLSL